MDIGSLFNSKIMQLPTKAELEKSIAQYAKVVTRHDTKVSQMSSADLAEWKRIDAAAFDAVEFLRKMLEKSKRRLEDGDYI